ncbi:AbrB/MazE/SpoVT family DNA-binding domain-containing protein [Candidatus Saccharibacteria bacterium]|nr:AbrB/MazE/SpoVT family DNA-binding domain-containing protein [Candidatus Saccharibacteria bacterium]
MYIYGKTHIDKNDRILLSGFFAPEELPGKIVLVVDAGMEMITVIKAEEKPELGTAIPVDEKGRVTLPKWLREELKPSLNDENELFFVYDGGKRYISPKTGDIL